MRALSAIAFVAICFGVLKSRDLAEAHLPYTHPITALCVVVIVLNLIWYDGKSDASTRWGGFAAVGALILAFVEILSTLLTGAQIFSSMFNLQFQGVLWARGEMGLDTAGVLFLTLLGLRLKNHRMLGMVTLVASVCILLVTAVGKWTGLPMFGGKMSDFTLVALGFVQGAVLMSALSTLPMRVLIMDSATGRNVRWLCVGFLMSISIALWASYEVGKLSGYYSARDLSMTMVALSALAASNFALVLWFGAKAQLAELTAERHRKSAEYHGQHDYLTGLLNRRAGARILADRIAGAVAKRQALYVALLDIDHFKRINDTLGHQIGDQVLTQVARILKSQMRPQDTLVRWGGEEFLICIAPRLGECALDHANQLRTRLAETPLMVGDSNGVERITVSVGISELHPEKPSLREAIGQADEALLRAKDGGRNRVERAIA